MACTARPAVLLRGLDRQVAGDPADRANAHHGLLDPPQAHPVADGLHRVPEDIEADADVGDGGGRESGDVA